MSTPRRSTPRRARSSSVTSNTSATSNTPNTTTTTASGRKSKKVKEPKQPKEPAASQQDDQVRPQLPSRLNPVLPETAPEVKLQIIRREQKAIVVGRVKLPTVNHDSDHAFLLKRFDTDAMAASSMFRVAFPYADQAEERAEMDYLEERFDCVSANGGKYDPERATSSSSNKKGSKSSKKSSKEVAVNEDGLPEGSTGVKLQGTWIPAQDALSLAKEYGLYEHALPLVEAKYVMEGETPVLVSSTSTSSSKSTPRVGKRQKVVEAAVPESIASATTASTLNGSPALVNTKTTKSKKADGTEEILIEKTETSIVSNGTALTPEEIEAQIKASKNLVKDVKSSKASSTSTSNVAATPSRKRRALNDAPTAEATQLLDDEEEEFEGNAVLRTFRRGTRVARRRPLATSAGTLGAGVAVGAASLAYIAGGNLDVALQILQNGATQVGSWFF